MAEFTSERAALAEHLTWMATAAARLKAYSAHMAAYMRDSAVAHTIPEGKSNQNFAHVMLMPQQSCRDIVAAMPGSGSIRVG